MYYVYIIKSSKNSRLYYGYTNNLRRRLEEHNCGKNYSTKFFRPYSLVCYEAYADQRDAISREQSLKNFGQGIYRLKQRLRYSLELTQSM